MAPKKERERKLPPRSNHRISLKAAAALTRRYREASPASEKTGFFHAEALRDLLGQPGCVGFRYYHGLDAKGRYHIVFVGVNEKGDDIVRAGSVQTASAHKTKGGEAVILQNHFPCPPWCPTPGALNS